IEGSGGRMPFKVNVCVPEDNFLNGIDNIFDIERRTLYPNGTALSGSRFSLVFVALCRMWVVPSGELPLLYPLIRPVLRCISWPLIIWMERMIGVRKVRIEPADGQGTRVCKGMGQ